MWIYLFGIRFELFQSVWQTLSVDIYMFSLEFYLVFSFLFMFVAICNDFEKRFRYPSPLAVVTIALHWNACITDRYWKNHQKNTSLDKIVWVSTCRITHSIRFVQWFFPCSSEHFNMLIKIQWNSTWLQTGIDAEMTGKELTSFGFMRKP